jgi:hypothetical protein
MTPGAAPGCHTPSNAAQVQPLLHLGRTTLGHFFDLQGSGDRGAVVAPVLDRFLRARNVNRPPEHAIKGFAWQLSVWPLALRARLNDYCNLFWRPVKKTNPKKSRTLSQASGCPDLEGIEGCSGQPKMKGEPRRGELFGP